jgi:hypothetical protein
MLGRGAILAAAVVVLVLLTHTDHAYQDCARGRADVYLVAYKVLPAAREPGALEAVRRRCRGTDGLLDVAAAMARQGRATEATAFALAATQREPGSPLAWGALARVARTANPRLAATARERAIALNPLEPPPAPATAAPRPARAGTSRASRRGG